MGSDDTYIKVVDKRGNVKEQNHASTIVAGYHKHPSDGDYVIKHDIPEIVSVRKYKVDIKKLQNLLSSHKNKSINEISKELNLPKTQVAHWFRKDKSFSIPPKEVWHKLKKILSIKNNSFDKSITTFIEKESVFEKTNRVYDTKGIAPTLTSTGADEKIIIGAMRGRNPNNPSDRRKGIDLEQRLEVNTEGVSNTLTSVQKDNYVIGDYRNDEGYRERKDGDSPCLATRKHSETDISTMPPIVNKIRRLTPLECERLQGFPDNWTKYGDFDGEIKEISDTQRYKQCGNAVTVDVVKEIFSKLYR